MNRTQLSAALLGLSFPVILSAADMDIGSEYQLGISFSREDALSASGIHTQGSSSLQLRSAKLITRALLSDGLVWLAAYRLKEGELERFYVTQTVNTDLDITVGRQKIKLYGMHRKLNNGTSPLPAAYLALNPLKEKLAIDLSYKIAGMMSLQIVEDYSKCSEQSILTNNPATQEVKTSKQTQCSSWNSSGGSSPSAGTPKQPAVTWEWAGSFGAFTPMLQYARYDLAKSGSSSLSLRFKQDGWDVYSDWTLDQRSERSLDPLLTDGSLDRSFVNLLTYAEYKVDRFTPFLQFAQLETKMLNQHDLGPEKRLAYTLNTPGRLDTNERTLALGNYFENWGAIYRPYLLISGTSSKVQNPNQKTESLTLQKTDVTAGISGRW